MRHRAYLLRPCQSGFTLVELSIVIIIIGLLTAGGLAVGSSMVERAAYIDTQKLVAQIQQTLRDYYIVHGRLPCVARFTDTPGAATFGTEITTCTTSTSAPGGTLRDATGNPPVRIGMVPVRTLGLPDTAAQDKYGNRYIYAVTEMLTSTADFGGEPGGITVKDASGNNILTNAAYFIASTGRDRKGSYSYQTATIPTACGSSANLDVLNCTTSVAEFRDAPYNNGDIEDQFFDDITAWAPKFHFMAADTESTSLWKLRFGTQDIYSVGTDDNVSTTKVGIGTATPQATLHLDGNANTLRLEGADHTYMEFYPDGPLTRKAYIGFPSGTTDHLTIRNEITDAHINLLTTGALGNVGIGDTSPIEKLHVAGNLQVASGFLGVGEHGATYMHLSHPNYKSLNNYAVLQHGTAGHLYLNSTNSADDTFIGDILFRHKNADQMRLKGNTGHLGIGIASPQTRLHINGAGTHFSASNKLQGTNYPGSEYNQFGAVIQAPGLDSGGLLISVGDDNNDEKAIDVFNQSTNLPVFRVRSKGDIFGEHACRVVTGATQEAGSTANCGADEWVMSGGGNCAGGTISAVHKSIPKSDLSGWIADCYSHNGTGDVNVTAYAICCKKGHAGY